MKLIRILSLLLGVMSASAASAEKWTLVEQSSFQAIYIRDLPYSEYHQTKADVILNANLKHVLRLFPLEINCWPWQRRCLGVELLKVNYPNSAIVHAKIDMPWPFTNRDFVFYSESTVSDNGLVIHFIPSNHRVQNDEYVRASGNISYEFVSLGEHQTLLTIISHVELNGSVAPGLVNNQLVSEARLDIDKMVKLLEQ